jgi:hypothetical protein
MVTWNKKILLTAGCLLALSFAGLLTARKVSAAIRAAFVEVVIPSQPFFGHMNTYFDSFLASTGPDTGVLGITNITVTNNEFDKKQVVIFAPLFSGGGCGSKPTSAAPAPSPLLTINVDAFSTQTITYPTPLVFGGVQGHTCVGVQAAGNAEITVNGFVN